MKEYMVQGDIYVGNMTQELTIKSSKTPNEFFEILREINPAPFGG